MPTFGQNDPAALCDLTTLATIIGLMPKALNLDERSKSHIPFAHAHIGGLPMLVIFIVFLVPAGFDLVYGSQ
jgi:HAE1 family hydrophobic/amphiphilic exporter-1